MLKIPASTPIRSAKKDTEHLSTSRAKETSLQEDLAHEFHTDVLQIRINHPITLAPTVSDDQRPNSILSFIRTLAEAVRLAAVKSLEVDQRELSATVREGLAAIPRLFSTTMSLVGQASASFCSRVSRLRQLLETTMEVLNCVEGCTAACRACLFDYSNQAHWEIWIGNRYSPGCRNSWPRRWVQSISLDSRSQVGRASRSSSFVRNILRATHQAIAVAPILANLTQLLAGSGEGSSEFNTGFLKRVVAWMSRGTPWKSDYLSLP